MKNVFIALTAHYVNFDVAFVQSIAALVHTQPCDFEIHWDCEGSIERSRNKLAKQFLQGNCTHFLTIDSDIGFYPEDVNRISSHDVDVVGGLYPLKGQTPNVEWCMNMSPAQAAIGPREDGLQRVQYVGCGFMCVRREVFPKMLAALGPLIEYQSDYDGQTEHAFFAQAISPTPTGRRYLTEDWLFCQRWIDLGGKVFADLKVALRHAGRALWPLPGQAGNPFEK